MPLPNRRVRLRQRAIQRDADGRSCQLHQRWRQARALSWRHGVRPRPPQREPSRQRQPDSQRAAADLRALLGAVLLEHARNQLAIARCLAARCLLQGAAERSQQLQLLGSLGISSGVVGNERAVVGAERLAFGLTLEQRIPARKLAGRSHEAPLFSDWSRRTWLRSSLSACLSRYLIVSRGTAKASATSTTE